MSEAIISLKDIHKSYGKNEVLKGVTLNIEKGVIYGLIGKNGSGKSTIFKTILGLSDYTSGELQIGAAGESLDEGRKRIGFLVGNNYFPYMTAAQNLKYYSDLKGIKDQSEIDRVLSLVSLSGVKSKVGGYSLGMRQRLGIANAMLGNPEIIILDEPTNGLDPQGIADIRNLLQMLNKEYGTTIVVSSHILGELQNTAHRFAILNDGVIVKVLNEDELSVTDESVRIRVNDVEKATAVLEENGIEILEKTVETRSLESFYFSLIGGKENA